MKRLFALISALTAVVVLASPASAQTSYTWQVSFKGSVGCGANWGWL